MRIVTLWLCAKLGLEIVRPGSRQIPKGHLNFDPTLAKAFGGRDGVNRAIIYQYVANWVIYNQEHGKNYVDGRFWSYNSGRAWAEMIGLWDSKTVENHIRFLRDSGILDANAMKAHKGDQTLWYALPSDEKKDSNGWSQIPLSLESNAPMGGAKDSNGSSIPQPASSVTPIKKRQQQQPRASAHTDGGGVAQFPKRDLDPKEFSEPKPEVRDAPPSEDGSREDGEAQTPPPVPPVPLPEWMPGFFTGCAESELIALVQQHGEALLLSAKKYAENPINRIDNPAGFVRAQLAKGWRPPAGWSGIDTIRYDNTDGRAYVSGEFADFVEH